MNGLPIGEVVCGDAAEVLVGFPEESFDLAIADPPYGISGGGGLRARHLAKEGRVIQPDEWGEEDREVGYEWLSVVLRVLRDGGSAAVFCAQRQFQELRDAAEEVGFITRQGWVWTKTNPSPTVRPNFASAFELGFWFRKPGGRVTWNGGFVQPNWFNGALYSGTYASNGRIHPMQKPEWLLDEFMRLWTNPGDLVLDLFSGSATTSVCALRAGCSFVAVEKDPAHCEKARARIAKAQRAHQDRLDFGPAEEPLDTRPSLV